MQWHVDGSCSTLTLSTRVAGHPTDQVASLPWSSNHPNPWPQAPTCAGEARTADLDGDGLQDLLFLTWIPVSSNHVELHVVTVLATGEGTWGIPSTDQSFGVVHDQTSNLSECAVGDYNGDNHDDLACTVRDSSWNVVVIASLGNGAMKSLGETSVPGDPGWAVSMRAIEVNADGKTDVVIMGIHGADSFQPPACQVAGASCPHLNFITGVSTGTGGFVFEAQDTTQFAGILSPRQIFTGDVDGDGHGDIVVMTTSLFSQQSGAFEVFTALNRGSGENRWTFTTQDGTNFYGMAAFGDYDGDGASDLLLAIPHNANDAARCSASIGYLHPSFWPAISRRDGTFGLPTDVSIACGIESTLAWYPDTVFAATDTNGDGKADWLSIGPPDAFRTVADLPAPNANNDARRWQRADLNGDGREDWVYVGYANPGFQVFGVVSQPDGSFTRQEVGFAPSMLGEGSRVDAVHDWFAIDVGGPDGIPDGKTDVVIVDNASGTVTTLLSTPGGWTKSVQRHWIVTPGAHHWISVDLDGDGRRDLALVQPGVTNGGVAAVKVSTLRSVGDGTWTVTNDLDFIGTMTDQTLSAFHVTDLDGDGRSDLVHVEFAGLQAGSNATTIRTLRSRGDGTFVENTQSVFQPFVDAHQYLPVEVNGDGRVDLARMRGVYGGWPVLVTMLSIGDTTFESPSSTYTTSAGPIPWEIDDRFVPADLDQDGKVDFYQLAVLADATGALSTSISVMWNQPSGVVVQTVGGLSPTSRDVGSYELADLGGDGRPDLIRIGSAALDLITLNAPAGRIIEQTNGVGGRTEIDYATTTGTSGNLPAGSVLPIVRQIQIADDVTGLVADTTTYGFDGATFDYHRHQLLGFEQTSTATARARTATTNVIDDRCGARPRLSTLANSRNAVIARTSSTFAPETTTGHAPYACLVDTTIQEQCEGGSSCRSVGEQTTYDTYGNVARIWEQGDLSDPTDDRLTETPSYPNTTDYVVSHPAYRNVSGWNSTTSRWQLAQSTMYLYDHNATYAQPPGRRGELTTERRWNDQTGKYIDDVLAYDKYGNLASKTGPATPHAPLGATETFSYDCTFHRFPENVCNAKYCVSSTWDFGLGLMTSSTDANLETSTTKFDPFGRPLRTDYPDSSFATWDYAPPTTWGTAAQRVRHEVSDDSPGDGVHWTETYVDGLERPIRTIAEGGATTEIAYDGASTRPAAESSPYRAGDPVMWTLRTYDAANRVTLLTLPDRHTRQTVFDVGTVTTYDERGASKIATSDGLGRIVAVEEQLRTCARGDECTVTDRNVTTYGYDVLSRLSWIRDALGNWTTNDYDSLSRRLHHCSPDAGCVTDVSADDGLLLSETDAARNQVTMTYDLLGRPILREVTDSGGATTRTVKSSWDLDPSTGQPAGASIGRIVEQTDLSTTRVVHVQHWGQMGRVDTEHDCVGSTCIDLAYRFDHAGRAAQIIYPDATGKQSSSSLHVTYAYDSAGKLSAIPGFANYIYDAAGRPLVTTFANGVVETRTVNPYRGWTDEIHTAGPRGAVLDEIVGHEGELVRSTDRKLTWNAEAYPIEIDDRVHGTSVQYAYDASGARVSKQGPAGLELSFGSSVELEASGQFAIYIQGNGQPIARLERGRPEYLHRDHLGSVRATTDASGAVVTERSYGTWGDVIASNGTPSVPQQYVGAHGDDENGLVLLGARYYDSDLGQMLSPDSIIPDVYVPQSLHPYSYVLNDPMTYVDPSGHDPEDSDSWKDDPDLYPDPTGSFGVGLDLSGTSNPLTGMVPVYDEDHLPPGDISIDPRPATATNYGDWLARQDHHAGLSDEQRDTWDSIESDDYVSNTYIQPAVRTLSWAVRWAAVFDETGLIEARLDQADQDSGIDSSGGETQRILRGTLSMAIVGLGGGAERAIGAEARMGSFAESGVLEIRVSKRFIGEERMGIVEEKIRKANELLRDHAEQGAFYRAYDSFDYEYRQSQQYLHDYFENNQSVSSVRIGEFAHGSQVDELISRFWGGPQLSFNQHLMPADINMYMGSVEYAAVMRQGVVAGDVLNSYKIVWVP